jgi:hypothetical protein
MFGGMISLIFRRGWGGDTCGAGEVEAFWVVLFFVVDRVIRLLLQVQSPSQIGQMSSSSSSADGRFEVNFAPDAAPTVWA